MRNFDNNSFPSVVDETFFDKLKQGSTLLPEGRVQMIDDPDLKLLHFRYLGIEYILEKHHARASRVSQVNRGNNWSHHYFESKDSQIEKFNSALLKKPGNYQNPYTWWLIYIYMRMLEIAWSRWGPSITTIKTVRLSCTGI